MVLIPGLACSGAVWDDFVRHYADRYEMHVLTLAGFAGEKPISTPLLATVRADLAKYIGTRLRAKPIVVGHSLGGSLALWLAEANPDLVAAVVAVDGVPYLPALIHPGTTPDEMAAAARQIADGLAHSPPEALRASNRATAATMVTDPAQVERISAWGAASDPASVGEAMAELMTTDLRPREGQIRAPVLLVAAGKGVGASADRVATAYEAQVARIGSHRVVVAENARHFIMLDDPSFLYAAIDGFSARAGAGGESN